MRATEHATGGYGRRPGAAVRVHLRIVGAGELHGKIEEQLNISGADSHREGEDVSESFPFLSAGKFPRDVWRFLVPVPSDEPLADHLRWAADFIRPHLDFLTDIQRNGSKMDICCSFIARRNPVAFDVPLECLEVFLRANTPVRFLLNF